MDKTCCLCSGKHKAKGYCNSHYQNFKTSGDALGKTRRPKNNCIASFLDLIDSIPINEKGCKIWPKGINGCGYGNYSIGNITYSAHRLLFTTVNGLSYHGLVVRHKCDVRSCCNIDHLEIGTQSDNLTDASKRNRLRIGECNNMSVLTEETVLYLRRSYPKKSTWELSREVGLDSGNVGKAISGKTWKHLPNAKTIISNNSAKGIKHHKAKLTNESVTKIREEYPNKNGTQLAKEHGVAHGTVYAILNRRIWTHI